MLVAQAVKRNPRLVVAVEDLTSGEGKLLTILNKYENKSVLQEEGLILKIPGHYPNEAVRYLQLLGWTVFLDRKASGTPEEVKRHIFSISTETPLLVTVSGSSGEEAVAAAVEAGKENLNLRILVWTVSTSLSPRQCKETLGKSPLQVTKKYAAWANELGAAGIVCSGRELPAMQRMRTRGKLRPDLLFAVPGIRLLGRSLYNRDDQKRILPPKEALRHEADLLIVGRPISEAANPLEVIEQLLEMIRKQKDSPDPVI